MGSPRVKLLCPECGAEDVVLDAYAAWDVETQDWVLHSTYEEKRCNTCGAEFDEADEEAID